MRGIAAFAALSLAATSWAQELVHAPRADGSATPLRVYAPHRSAACPPLALISPGAGGSENGYSYLAEGLRNAGWRALVMGHQESGRKALRTDVGKAGGLRGGLMRLTTDPAAYAGRMSDIAAALSWADSTCKAPARVLLGHSMGAATVMMEAGARNKVGVTGGDRFDGYVALSPEGPGSIFPEGAWSGIHKPLLILTGTKDQALEGGWQSRTVPFDSLPPGCKWLAVIDDASHMNFAGRGMSASVEKATLAETRVFLQGVQRGQCGAPVRLDGVAMKEK